MFGGGFNADYVDSIYERIRRSIPFTDKTSTRPELRKVALAPTSERRTARREPILWEIKPIEGFRRPIRIPELQDESKRQESKDLRGRDQARRRGGRNRSAGYGAFTDTEMEASPPVTSGNSSPVRKTEEAHPVTLITHRIQ